MGPPTGQFKVICVFTLLLWTVSATSQVAPPPLQQTFFGSQFYLLEVMTDFERYRNGQGQADVYGQLSGHLIQFRAHFDALTSAPGLPETDREALQQHWQGLARNLSALLVTVRQGGFIDQEIRYQYQEQASLLWQHLLGLSLAEREPDKTEQLILLLQLANLRYMEAQWRLAPYAEHSLPQMADDIEARFSALPDAPADISRKWPLLHKALQQEGGSMSFIVNRYAGDLVTLLRQQLALD
ncbi:MAG: hypothetical protein VYA55_12415 [Pseudomonadota bacterium]|nr:hypothetical protein [Pseudomonadota bacterium]